MRLFTTIKTGYTASTYGCTGEYYTTILINGKNTTAVKWHGMFGADYRVKEYLQAKGYKEFYTPAEWGQLKTREINRASNYSEHQLIDGGKLQEKINSIKGGSR